MIMSDLLLWSLCPRSAGGCELGCHVFMPVTRSVTVRPVAVAQAVETGAMRVGGERGMVTAQ